MAKPLSPKVIVDTFDAINKHTNKQKAAKELNVPVGTFKNRVIATRTLLQSTASVEKPKEDWQPQSAMLLQKERDESSKLRARISELLRDGTSWNVVREKVLQLTAEPFHPADVKLPKTKAKGQHLPEAVILHLSDLHWGEVIRESVMGDLNKYDMEIASWRLVRCIQTTIGLMTRHWPKSGQPPAHLIVMLGGDMISGDIHDELKKTNDLQSIPVMVDCIKNLALALTTLLDALDCEISVYCVPGNHGRTTIKPESKTYVDTNYDTMIYDMLEWHFVMKGAKRIKFYRPQSGDALFRVFDFQCFLTHGDRIGSRGGQGFVGPAATIARGMKKVIDEHAAMRVFIDYMFIGHFHTSLKLEYGWSNGSLPGPSEYSRDLRSRPTGATQNYFTLHPEHGVTSWREIQVGAPEEGMIYRMGR